MEDDEASLQRSASASAARFSLAHDELNSVSSTGSKGDFLSDHALSLLVAQAHSLLEEGGAEWGRGSRALKLLGVLRSGLVVADARIIGLLNAILRRGSQLDQVAGDPAAVVLAVFEAMGDLCRQPRNRDLLCEFGAPQAALDALAATTKRAASTDTRSEMTSQTTAALALVERLLQHQADGEHQADGAVLADEHCHLLCQLAQWRPALTDQPVMLLNDAHAGLALHCLRSILASSVEQPPPPPPAAAAATVGDVELQRMSSAEQLQHAMALSMADTGSSGGGHHARMALVESTVGQALSVLGADEESIDKMLGGARLQPVGPLVEVAVLAEQVAMDRLPAMLTPTEWTSLQANPFWDARCNHPTIETLKTRMRPPATASGTAAVAHRERSKKKVPKGLQTTLLTAEGANTIDDFRESASAAAPFYSEEDVEMGDRERNQRAADLFCQQCLSFPGLCGLCCGCYCLAGCVYDPLRRAAHLVLRTLPSGFEYNVPVVRRIGVILGGFVHFCCSALHVWVVFSFFGGSLHHRGLYYMGLVLLCLSACCLCR